MVLLLVRFILGTVNPATVKRGYSVGIRNAE
jgi:hypothetical protein